MLTQVHSDPDAEVLMVTNMWPHAGNPKYGVFIKRQIDSLIDAGVPCDVYFIRGHRSPLAYAYAALVLFVWNFRRSRRYSLVHAHGGESAIPVRAYLRAPVLVSYCGDDVLGTPGTDGRISRAHRVRRWLLRQHARLMTATLTKSAGMEEALPAGVRRRNSVIPNGVDSEAFRPSDRLRARDSLGWSADERVVLFANDPAVPRKRHGLAETACEIAARELGEVRLHVAADVAPAKMPTLMSAADCLILTSIHEGSPNVVKEALMCNLPVVSTPVGDVPERLADIEPSWLAEDAEALGAALVDCLRRPRRSNGRAAAAEITIERIAQRVITLYGRLVPELASLAADGGASQTVEGRVNTEGSRDRAEPDAIAR